MIQFENLTAIQKRTLKLYPNYKLFYNDLSPARLLVAYDNINTIEESIAKPRMTIEDINIIYPETEINNSVNYIARWLDFLNKFSNINKQLTELNAVAYMIYKDYKFMYLTDLKIIFEKIMRAEYGPFYGSVDAQRILYGFMQYNLERSILTRKQRDKYNLDLEDHLDKTRNSVSLEILKIMKKDFNDIEGQDYWEKRKDFENKMMPVALKNAREEFLNKYLEEHAPN